MRLFSATVFVTLLSLSCGRPQQGIDPAYLRQYYQQLAQNTGAQAPSDGTPIYESESRQDSAPRYLPGGQQIRIKDTVNEQVSYIKVRVSQMEHILFEDVIKGFNYLFPSTYCMSVCCLSHSRIKLNSNIKRNFLPFCPFRFKERSSLLHIPHHKLDNIKSNSNNNLNR